MSEKPDTMPATATAQKSQDHAQAEVIREPLYTESEVKQALYAGALASAILGGLIGIGIGYTFALQDRRTRGER